MMTVDEALKRLRSIFRIRTKRRMVTKHPSGSEIFLTFDEKFHREFMTNNGDITESERSKDFEASQRLKKQEEERR